MEQLTLWLGFVLRNDIVTSDSVVEIMHLELGMSTRWPCVYVWQLGASSQFMRWAKAGLCDNASITFRILSCQINTKLHLCLPPVRLVSVVSIPCFKCQSFVWSFDDLSLLVYIIWGLNLCGCINVGVVNECSLINDYLLLRLALKNSYRCDYM